MNNPLIKTFISLLLVIACSPSQADVSILWKDKLDVPINNSHRSGRFISVQKDTLFISNGIAGNAQYPVAELIPKSISEQDPPIVHAISLNKTDNFHSHEINIDNLAFSGSFTHQLGTFIVGGTNGTLSSNQAKIWLYDKDSKELESISLPELPVSTSSPSLTVLDNYLHVLTGSDSDNKAFRLDLSNIQLDSSGKIYSDKGKVLFTNELVNPWQELPELPFQNQNFSYRSGVKLVTQYDGISDTIYAIGGYFLSKSSQAQHSHSNHRIESDQYRLTQNTEVWKLKKGKTKSPSQWEFVGNINIEGNELSKPIKNVIAFGKSHILAFTDEQILSFNSITNSWVEYTQAKLSNIDEKQVFTAQASAPYLYDGSLHALVKIKGEPKSYSIIHGELEQATLHFGTFNMSVLIGYLIFVVLVGVFFMFKNKDTNDYFRGGQSIPWWAAACSIYATMLSSLTYVALPAIVYQTQWLLLIGIWMMVLVAPVAIYVAMPFFRQIDATSAYEYLSKRFNTPVRLFASGLFTLFHIGRMGIVMALTALALSAVTPLSASESVLIMGVLCLIYCTLGGIEAVIWTDTLQTVVLLLGAVICFVTIILGIDGGLSSYIEIGMHEDKFTMLNNDFSLESITTLSIWVIVLGGIGQNLSSYTADQAIVQRYMVTKNPKDAEKAIWTNALMAIPGTLLFFGIGTGLYVFYKTNPGKLDPTIQIDQIFPTFIATELPVGVAGLIVAGIFAAAQSTVSTSMNSISTTVVTDFIRPFNLIKTEKGYMNVARLLTFIMGTLGTLAGLIFINPEIRSLMEAYFKVIGMFMGALGGLFVLGILSKKANASGAIIGILSGVAMMISAWQMGWANGYLYATIGIISCLVIGYLASFLFNSPKKNIEGLTLYTMKKLPIT